jgi:hypothetical protein
MYSKRRKANSADLRATKEELRAEMTQDLMSMLASQGLQIVLVSKNTSPAPRRRSSCVSASAATENNNGPLMNEDEDLE